MEITGGVSTVFETLCRRELLIRRLVADPACPGTLTEDLDSARSTINRGVSELEAANLIVHADGAYRPTLTGELALEEFDRLVDRLGEITAARTLLGMLPADAPIDRRLLDGAAIVLTDRETTVSTADEPQRGTTPAEPASAIEALLEPQSHHRLFTPTLDHPLVDTYANALQDDLALDVTVPTAAFDRVSPAVRQEVAGALAAGTLSLSKTTSGLPYALIVVDFQRHSTDRPFDSSDETTAVALLVVCENGTLRGLVANDAPGAIEWATTKLAAIEATAQRVGKQS